MSINDEQDVLSLGDEDVYWLMSGDNETPAALTERPLELSAAEWTFYNSLRTDKRRHDWLLGRRTAKRLLGALWRDQGESWPADAITILPHADGWPMVTLPSDNHAAVSLSISHSHGRAFCAAVARPGWPLGADIEWVEPRASAFVADYFTPLEQEFLAAAPTAQSATLENAIWSGKEAALKAIRRGLAEDTRLVSCLPHPLMNGRDSWLPMPIIWNGGEASARPALNGYWRARGGFVLTLAIADASSLALR